MITNRNKSKLLNNQKWSLNVQIADSANFTTIFMLFLNETLKRFLEQTGRFIFFPAAAFGGIVNVILAWREVQLDKSSSRIFHACVKTVCNLAILFAVLGTFLAPVIFTTLAPKLFIAAIAIQTTAGTVAAGYHLVKYALGGNHKDPAQLAAAKANAIGAVAGALSAVAVGFVMLASQTAFAACGVLAGFIGCGYAIHKRCTMRPKIRTTSDSDSSLIHENDINEVESKPANTRSYSTLRSSPQHTATNEWKKNTPTTPTINNSLESHNYFLFSKSRQDVSDAEIKPSIHRRRYTK
jgi:hypothetical protein